MTVSYGTFSCSLDGFDDPFETMQSVAQYFRKLAAEDRYFGGTPLQADENNLHKIARDVNPNKVDARVTKNSVVLRQADVVDVSARKTVKTPEFSSKRVAPAVKSKPVAMTDKDSFVAAAIFSSRRHALEPAATEPKVSTATLLREVAGARKTETASAPTKPVSSKVAAPASISAAKAAAEIAKDLASTPANVQEKPLSLKGRDRIQSEDESLERLLETTNFKLNAPALARRSNALERLKAAVAATEAERRMREEATTNHPKSQEISGEPDTFRQKIKSVRKTHELESKITRPVVKRSGKMRRGSNIATLVLGADQQVKSEDNAPAKTLKKKRVMGR